MANNSRYKIIDSVDTLKAALEKVREAQKVFSTYTQEQVDRIFLAAASAANKARILLAKMAVEETGMGVLEDKVIKNHYASEYIYNAYGCKPAVLWRKIKIRNKENCRASGCYCGGYSHHKPDINCNFQNTISTKTRNGIILVPPGKK